MPFKLQTEFPLVNTFPTACLCTLQVAGVCEIWKNCPLSATTFWLFDQRAAVRSNGF